MENFIIVYTTASSELESNKIAEILINEGLAACINVIPGMRSFYLWDNKVQKGNEFVLIIKTQKALYDAVKNKILDIHSYETPCILVIPIVEVENAYSNWLKSQCKVE